MDNNKLMQKVENLIINKKYDSSFIPMIKAFFLLYNRVYNPSEEQLDKVIQNYAENIDKIEYFNIGREKHIVDSKRKAMIFDTDYLNNVDKSNVEKYLINSIQAQSVAIQKDISSENINSLVEITELNNLYDKGNPHIKNLLTMICASFGSRETSITKIIEEFKEEYSKLENDRGNPKRHYYDDMIFLVYRDALSKIFVDIANNKGEPDKEICKKIYAICLVNLNSKIIAFGKENQDIESYQIIKNTMKEFQKTYQISDEELAKVNVEKNWDISVNNIESKILSELNIQDVSYEKKDENNNQIPRINRDKLIDMLNSRKENKEITQEEIENAVNQMVMEKQYPIEVTNILNEYFKRSAFVYEWDKNTLQKKIVNFKTNIDGFAIKKIEEGSVIAYCNFMEKKISISNDVMLVYMANRENLTTFFHEMRHVTDLTVRDWQTYESRNTEENINYGLDEMFVEAGATLLTGVKYTDKLKTTLKFGGYEDYSYTLSMLSSALGISDIDFIKLGEKGKEKLKENLEDKFQSNEVYKKLMKVDRLLNYQHPFSDTLKLSYQNEKASIYGQIYNICKDIYDFRMQKEPPMSEEEKLKARYEEYKINKNLLEAKKSIGMSKSILESTTGRQLSTIKEKSKLNDQDKKKILIKLSESQDIKFDNRQVNKSVKTFIKALFKNKKNKQNNLLSEPPKKQFLEDLKVNSENEVDSGNIEQDVIDMSVQSLLEENNKDYEQE